MLYGNDNDPIHSEFSDPLNPDQVWNSLDGIGPKSGHDGFSFTADKTIPKDESGHPIKHVFTNAIPSSQCITCHVHPGTTVTNSYLGYTWWDNETHGDLLYPKEEVKEDDLGKLEAERLDSNPEASAVRGLWGDKDFLKDVTKLNDQMKTRLNPSKFADFHGHGWIFRAVFKKDRRGNLLDADGNKLDPTETDKLAKAVQLRDIHIEKGMHCIDCHFKQDTHGNGKLYGAVRDAVEIDCIDCHGTVKKKANLATSGTAAPEGGNNMILGKTPWGPRFRKRGDKIIQRSMVVKGREWNVPQVLDIINPKSDDYNERAAMAKTMQKDGNSWGDPTVADASLAHSNGEMTCFSCHTSWVTSCFGCHLNMKTNRRRPGLHNEGTLTRNWTSYSMMTLRDDVFMLGKDGTSQKHRVAPTRSTCAVIVGSQNGNREYVYSQQQTVSTPGFSGHSFSTHVPHTVRAKETKFCTDCHVATDGDNNAVMAQLLMQGTNAYNFVGRYLYVGVGEEGVDAVVVTERDEPQAVIGSTLHKDAYPERYAKHLANGRQLTESYGHGPGGPFRLFEKGNVKSLQHRGEYLYLASGKRGLQVYDIANIDNKGFSQRITSAPVSPLGGQRLWVDTKYATSVASPSTVAVDPLRNAELRKKNEEQDPHLLYGFLYVTDRYEGLILVGAATLLDGDPLNNFLKRAVTFNPSGKLTGAEHVTIVGNYAYILTDRKLAVVDLSDPMNPQLTAEISEPLNKPKAISVQFRYAFVADADGLKVLDVTDLAHPKPVQGGSVELEEGGWNIYLVRTWAYVAGRGKGIAIIDVERPEQPKLLRYFDADGAINDTHDIKAGITNNSHFAYVADGRNGLRVVQLTSPYTTPGIGGFSPIPTPELIATYKTRGPALAISEGVDRDRAVDESGNQIAVFNRIGSRPFNKAEMEKMYLRDGNLWTAKTAPPSKPLEFKAPEEEKKDKDDDRGRKRRRRR